MKSKEMTLGQINYATDWVKTGVHILLGTLYVALLSHIDIPFKPIPMTMQTFAVFSLALSVGSRKSFFSLLLYLFAATLGLPVLSSGYVNPLWFLDSSAGYTLSFPLVAYIVGKCAETKKSSSPFWMFIGLSLGQGVIYLMGLAWLSAFVGFKQALIVGFYPFILFDAVKLMGALAAKMVAKHAGNYFPHLFKTGV